MTGLIGRCRALGKWLARIPLFYKVVLANSVMMVLLALAGTAIAVWHMQGSLGDPHYDLMALFAVAGFAISFATNSVVMKLVLTPLDRLQAALEDVQQGNLYTPICAGSISDERFDRLMTTFNQVLNALKQNAQQLHHLSQEILQAQVGSTCPRTASCLPIPSNLPLDSYGVLTASVTSTETEFEFPVIFTVGFLREQ
jgi:methyl-accepting chemotaxis protein